MPVQCTRIINMTDCVTMVYKPVLVHEIRHIAQSVMADFVRKVETHVDIQCNMNLVLHNALFLPGPAQLV